MMQGMPTSTRLKLIKLWRYVLSLFLAPVGDLPLVNRIGKFESGSSFHKKWTDSPEPVLDLSLEPTDGFEPPTR